LLTHSLIVELNKYASIQGIALPLRLRGALWV